MRPDHGAEEAARHGVARSEHWEAVERVFRATNLVCLACAPGDLAGNIQVHHWYPFHVVVALGRPDLELDSRNLMSLCESEEGRPAEDHHLDLGHLGNFRLGNLRARQDAQTTYHGMTNAAIRADADWQSEERSGRLKALDEMTVEDRRLLRQELDDVLPPDPAVCARYGFTIGPYSE